MTRVGLMATVALVGACVVSTTAHANGVGQLDPSFGVGGRSAVEVSRFGPEDVARVLAEQADGRLIVAGETGEVNETTDIAMFRLNPDGSRDMTFGADGLVRVDLGSESDRVNAIAVGPSRQITLLVDTWTLGEPAYLLRYGSDGVPVASFGGGDGRREVPGGMDLVVDGAGRTTVLSGGPVGSGDRGFTLRRFEADGSLDETFGEGGNATVVAAGSNVEASSLVRAPDGSLIAGGTSFFDNGTSQVLVARLQADGAIDATFGTRGLSNPGIGFTAGLAVDASGDIVVAANGSHGTIFAYRLKGDGTLDSAFGEQGQFRDEGPGADEVRAAAIVLEPGGRIVIGGTYIGNDDDAFLLGLTPDGRHDESFGDDGFAITQLRPRNYDGGLQDLVLTEQGGLAGATVGSLFFGALRWSAGGEADPDFGRDGFAKASIGALTTGAPYDAVAQPDGKLIAVGPATHVFDDYEEPLAFGIIRLLPDGTLDPSFDEDGRLIVSVPGGGYATSVADGPNGTVYVGGISKPRGGTELSGSDFTVARITRSGRLDRSFGANGVTTVEVGEVPYTYGRTTGDHLVGLAVQPDGSLVVGGEVDHSYVGLVRLEPDGSVDTGFGNNGRVVTFIGSFLHVAAVGTDSSGRILVSGDTHTSHLNADMIALRYLPDGRLDPSWGADGIHSYPEGERGEGQQSMGLTA